MMRHPVDSRVHFSELKAHVKSPAHVPLACRGARVVTRAMLVGGIADSIVFESGQRHAIFHGKVRAGKEWEAFRLEHAGKYLCNESEYEDASGAADAVLASDAARKALDGCRTQVVAQWDAFGLPCAAGIEGERGGFDAINTTAGYIADLKVTACTEPDELSRHIINMHWHAQLAWYRIGARAMGLPIDRCKLIAVEARPPHNVTVLRIPERWLVLGEQLVTAWAEKHRACEAADYWPGYVQSEIDAIEPAWMADHVELEGLDDDA
jgi:PDDEXK-like domain of unknown function (DUF3799)